MDGNPRIEAVNDVCELIGWDDPIALVDGLMTMREQRKQEQEQQMVSAQRKRR